MLKRLLLGLIAACATAYGSAYGPIDLKQYGWDGHMDFQNCNNCNTAQDEHSVFPLVASSPLGWWRDEINPKNWSDANGNFVDKGPTNWNQLWIDTAHANGVKVVLCVPASSKDDLPASWTTWDQPPYTQIVNWMVAMAQHFSGEVQVIEVFNEPNNQFNYIPGYPQAIGQITDAIAVAVHAAVPGMLVIGGGDQGPNMLAMMPLMPHVDGFTSHPYPNQAVNWFQPEGVYEQTSASTLVQWVGLLRQAANGKPLWFTEQGPHNAQGQDGESQSAYWWARRTIENIQLHVEHSFMYEFGSTDDSQSSMDFTLSPRQNWYMLQRLEGAIQGLYLRDWPVTASMPSPNFSSAVFDIWGNDGSYPGRTSLCVWDAGYMESRNAVPGSNPVYTTNLQVHHPYAQDVVALNLVTGESWKPTWAQSGMDVVIQNAEVSQAVIVYQIYNQKQ